MIPMYLGSKSAQIFATLHLPDSPNSPRSGVLLCSPFGQEAIRMHRFFRVLSDRLTRVGLAVMRFEYFGTGDSAGNDDQADLHRWSEDALLACEELKRQAGVGNIRWLGSRIGANIALDAIQQGGLSPESVTLWDPILDGQEYVLELYSEHEKRLRQVFRRPDYPWAAGQTTSSSDTISEANGYPLSLRIVEQMRALRFPTTNLIKNCPLTLIVDPADHRLTQSMASCNLVSPSGIVHLPSTFSWMEHQARNGIVVPSQAMKCLLNVLGA